MATLDIFILIVLGIGLLRGWKTGFLRQMAALAGTILAFVLSASFMGSAGQLISDFTGLAQEQSSLLGFMGLFVLVKLSVNIVTRAGETLLDKAHLSGMDRIAGGVTGAFKAAVAMSLVFVVIGFAHLPGEVSRENSDFYQPVYRLVPEAWSLLSDRAPAFDELRRKVESRLDFNGSTVPI